MKTQLSVLGFFFLFVGFSACSSKPIASSQTSPANMTPASEQQLFPIKVDRLYGYINQEGALVIPPQFEEADPFSEGMALVEFPHSFGFINPEGKILFTFEALGARSFSEGLAVVEVHTPGLVSKFGFIDREGKFAIPPQFQFADSFFEGRAFVQIEDKYSYIDKSGKTIVPPRFEADEDRFFKAQKDDYLQEEFDHAFHQGLAVVETDVRYIRDLNLPTKQFPVERCGFVNLSGKFVIPPDFEGASPFCEGLAAVKVHKKFGFINSAGQFVIPPRYHYTDNFSEGLAAFQMGQLSKFGYLDKTGAVKIPVQFDIAYPFSNGLALVGCDRKYFFINPAGKKVFDVVGDFWKPFKDGLASFSVYDASANDWVSGYIDTMGKVVWPKTNIVVTIPAQ